MTNSQLCPQCQATIEAPEAGQAPNLSCPSCGSPLLTQRLQEMLRIPSYSQWLVRVLLQTSSTGREGIALAALTAIVLGLSFLLLGSPIAAVMPPNSPNIILMAPFFAISALVFFLLAPFFYAAYKKRLSQERD